MRLPSFAKSVCAVALAAAAVALPAVAAAQDEGVKQVEALVKATGNTVQAIAQTKLQLLKAMDLYNALLADDARDRRKLYRDLQRELTNTERRRSEIAIRAQAMSTEAERLFGSWRLRRPRSKARACASAARSAWRRPRRATRSCAKWERKQASSTGQ